MTTANIMEAPSSQPSLIPCIKTPSASDIMAAAHRILIVSSSNVAKIMSVKVRGGLTMGALVPNFLILQSLSLLDPDIPVLRFVFNLLYNPMYPPILSKFLRLAPSLILSGWNRSFSHSTSTVMTGPSSVPPLGISN